MQTPVSDRIELARHAQGDLQIILSYDPKPEVIDALLDNHQLSTRNVVNMISRKILSEQHLERISSNQNWLSSYDVKFELIRNPRTPTHISLKLLRFMYRKELQAVSRDVAIPQSVRFSAIKKLENQLADLTVGEKIAVAKEAIGPLLTLLLGDSDENVVRAVLKNPRLRENEVIVMVNKKNLKEHIIRAVFESHWIVRYPVKAALANNMNTPYSIAVDIIPSLLQQDLQKLIGNTFLPIPTRVMARNMLKIRILRLTREQHIRLARDCPREVINILIEIEDISIIKSLEGNPGLLEGQMVSLAVNASSRSVIEYLIHDSLWKNNPKVIKALHHNPLLDLEMQTFIQQRTK